MPANAALVSSQVGEEDLVTAERLRTVVARLSRRTDRTLAGAGLTPAGTSVLAGIVRRGPLRLSDLASAEGLNPTMLSRLIHDLERAGLVAREMDASDRRASLVRATAAGSRLQGKIRTERSHLLSLVLARLSKDERAAISDALPALEALADELKGRTV